MKKIIVVALITFTCVVNAQRKPKIKGSRIVTEVEKELPPFNAIKLTENLKIKLQKATNPGYSIIADDNLIDVLKIEVKDSVLTIGAFYRIISKKQLDIAINFTSLNKIVTTTGVVFMNDMIGGDNLTVNTYGSSKVQLNTNAATVTIKAEGNSAGSYSVDTNSLALVLKDKSNSEIHAVSEEMNVEMYNGASIKLEGSTNLLNANLTGNSNIKGEKLTAVSIEALLQESTSARLHALENFSLTARDKSKTYLFGNPKITIIEFLDTSELHKRVVKEN